MKHLLSFFLLLAILFSGLICDNQVINDSQDSKINLEDTELMTYSFSSEPDSDNIITLKSIDGQAILSRVTITFQWNDEEGEQTYSPQYEGDTENILSNSASTPVKYTITFQCNDCTVENSLSFIINIFNELRRVIPLTPNGSPWNIKKLYKNNIIKFSLDNTSKEAIEFIITPNGATVNFDLYINGGETPIKTIEQINEQLSYKRFKEETSEDIKYHFTIKKEASEPESDYSIDLQINSQTPMDLIKIIDGTKVNLKGKEGQAIYLEAAISKIGDEAILSLLFQQDLLANELIVFSKEVNIIKEDSIINDVNEIYNNIPLTKDQSSFPLIQLTPKQYHLYYDLTLLSDPQDTRYIVIYIKTPDSMTGSNFKCEYSTQQDLTLSSEIVYESVTLMQSKPMLIRINNSNKKRLLISNMNKHKIYSGKMIKDGDNINNSIENQVYLIEKEVKSVVIELIQDEIEESTFYIVVEDVSSKNVKYTPVQVFQGIAQDCMDGIEQTFIQYTASAPSSRFIAINKQYGSYEYYIRTELKQTAPKGSILPSTTPEDKLTLLPEIQSNYFALTVKCLKESGRTEALFFTKEPLTITSIGKLITYIEQGESNIKLAEAVNNSMVELKIADKQTEEPVEVTIKVWCKDGSLTKRLIDYSSAFRTDVLAPSDIEIFSDHEVMLMIKFATPDEVKEKPIIKGITEYSQSHIFFKLNQPRVLTYKIDYESPTKSGFRISISKSADGYIPKASLPIPESSLSFHNPLNQYAIDLENTEFYYLAIGVPIQVKIYSLTITTTELEQFEPLASSQLIEIKPKNKMALDFSNSKTKPKLVMYCEPCANSEQKANFNFYYNSNTKSVSVDLTAGQFVALDNEYFPIDFDYSISNEETTILTSYAYLSNEGYSVLPKVLNQFPFEYNSMGKLNWTHPVNGINEYRIFIEENDSSSSSSDSLTNKCVLLKNKNYESVQGNEFTLTTDKYKYGKYSINILGLKKDPLPFAVLFKQQNIEFKQQTSPGDSGQGASDPFVWLWVFLGFIVFALIVVIIILVRRKGKINANSHKFEQFLSEEIKPPIEL